MSLITTTTLFSDIESSTDLWDRHPAAMKPALEQHDQLIATAFRDVGLRLDKHTGDGRIIAADDGSAMLAAAVAIQQQLPRLEWGDLDPLRVRIGLHLVTAHWREGDLFGPDMNLAARVMGGAAGGQIVATAQAIDHVELPDECTPRSLGLHRFRGVRRPVEVFEIDYPGAPSELPAYRSASQRLGNLPALPADLIARDGLRSELLNAADGAGIVTLVGPGGVGKTTAALTAAGELASTRPDGCWFVDLSSIGGDGEVTALVERTIDLHGAGARAGLDGIAAALSSRTMAVVLDNAEHVLPGVQRLLDDVVRDDMSATLIVTSREPTGHRAERVVAVPPLATVGEGSEAVELFVNRARRVRPDFSPDRDGLDQVRTLCTQLDGLPLAVELAASRLSVLSLEELVENLGTRLRVLAAPGTGRQATMRSTVEWSYRLLSEGERAALRRLALFEAPVDLTQAAAAIGLDRLEAVDQLAQLVHKSVLQALPGEERRFKVLEPIRFFVLERLEEAGEHDLVADQVVDLVQKTVAAAEPAMDGPGQVACFDSFEVLRPSLRIAIERLLDARPEQAVDLLVRLYQFWMTRGSQREALEWHQRAASGAEDVDPGLASRASADASTLAYFIGDNRLSRDLCDASIAVAEAAGIPTRPTALLRRAGLQVADGDIGAAVSSCELALDTLAKDHRPDEPAGAAAAIGAFLSLAGQPELGIAVCEQALAEQLDPSPSTRASDAANLGYACHAVDLERSVAAFLESRRHAQVLGSNFYLASAGVSAGHGLVRLGRHDEALRLMASAIDEARSLGLRAEVLGMISEVATIILEQGRGEGELLGLAAARLASGAVPIGGASPWNQTRDRATAADPAIEDAALHITYEELSELAIDAASARAPGPEASPAPTVRH